jgi:hypothetical protein
VGGDAATQAVSATVGSGEPIDAIIADVLNANKAQLQRPVSAS